MKHPAIFFTVALHPHAHRAHAQYNVRTFGAVGDGKPKHPAAFQKALDTCAVNGGGEVLVPEGDFLIGSVQIGTHTTLRLDKKATIHGSTDLADHPIIDVRWEGRWEQGLSLPHLRLQRRSHRHPRPRQNHRNMSDALAQQQNARPAC